MDESVASSSSPPNHHRYRRLKPLTDRIVRAMQNHLRLLHRSDSNFYVLGATGNVYSINLCTTPTCSCPDHTAPCKHILFVLIRVLGVSLQDICLRRRTIRPCMLHCLLNTPMLPDALAGANLRDRFHQLFFRRKQGVVPKIVEVEEGTACPICLDEMGTGVDVVGCRICRNVVHQNCLMKWKKSVGRRAVSCVICRARWRDMTEEDKYLNLSSYIGKEDMAETGAGLKSNEESYERLINMKLQQRMFKPTTSCSNTMLNN